MSSIATWSREELIVTFLALLGLMKARKSRRSQCQCANRHQKSLAEGFMVKEINLFEQEKTATKLASQPAQMELPDSIRPLTLPSSGCNKSDSSNSTSRESSKLSSFASNVPIPFTKIHEITETFHSLKPRQLRDLIGELQQEYLSQHRAFRLEEIADGYLLRSCEEYSEFIEKLYMTRRDEKLRRPRHKS